jgi:RHS repeat-associated protein
MPRALRIEYPGANRCFVYEGWNLISILDANTSGLPMYRAFLWGLDLSGSLQGAGGVGGVLLETGPTIPAQYYCFDGNGNVMALSRATDGTITARYEYAPFGETLVATGPRSSDNPFRFSTKFYDVETGLYYYTHRYYVPPTGRWLSRDPIEESGGIALYGFVNNCPLSRIDRLGLLTDEQIIYRNSACRKCDADWAFSVRTFPAPDSYNCSCCTADMITDGKNELMSRYKAGRDYLNEMGVLPDAEPGNRPNRASCYEANSQIMRFMSPTPPCWTCWIENRRPSLGPLDALLVLLGLKSWWDENAIVCTSHPAPGERVLQETIVFDWFDETQGKRNPGDPYSSFVADYGEFIEVRDRAAYQDCTPPSSESERPRDYKWLDKLIDLSAQ